MCVTVPHCKDGGGVDLEFGGVSSCRGRRGRLCRGAGIAGWRTGACLESREEDDVEQLCDRAPGKKGEMMVQIKKKKNGDNNKNSLVYV